MPMLSYFRRKLAWILPDGRPANLEVENENLRAPRGDGEPPRPATEHPGTKEGSRSEELSNDPGSGERLQP